VTGIEEGAGLNRSFVVTIKVPTGHEHWFPGERRAAGETVTMRAVAYFVTQGVSRTVNIPSR
jgi:hypothetical protein